jgi:ABC-type sugar transport system ATPase subunit
MSEILRVDRITKKFGAINALSDVSLSLASGEIRALCGENGAGKSTFVKILMGVHRADEGTIAIDGTVRDIRTPQMAQSLGLAMVAQELSLAPHLSILDNIWLGNRLVPLFHRRPDLRQKAQAALDQLGAGDYDLYQAVGTLTIGQRQIVEIARLIARNARILILDEPTATLSDREIARIFAAIKALKAENRAAIYITHRLGEVFEVCDTVTVLRNGQHIATHPVGEVDRGKLIELMLGRPLEDMYPQIEKTGGKDAALVIEHLSVPGAVSDCSFVAPRGKILCLSGQLGSGAQQALRAVAGLVPGATGTVWVNGTNLRLGSVPQALAHNVTFISEDRSSEGIFLNRSVLENLVATRFWQYTRFGVLSWPALREVGVRLAALARVDRQRLNARAADLSGGNQQKLLFGRGLERALPGVLLMNEPTHGVDVGSRAEIYRLMRQFCDLGYALVMTSSDLGEVVGISDVVITMYRGRVVSRYEGGRIPMSSILADITHPRVGAA